MKTQLSVSIAKKFAALLLIFALCSHMDVHAEETRSMTYTMKRFEQYSALTPETYWKCSYPVFSGSDAATAINRTLLDAVTAANPAKHDQGQGSLQAAATSFIAQFDALRKDLPEAMPWQSETSGMVAYNTPGLLTVGLTIDTFTGGAHGSNFMTYFVFDAKSGKQLRLNDLFVPRFEARLDKLIDRRFREIKGLSMTDRLDSEKGTLFENVIRHNSNFAVTGHGITFYYNPYEIAAYVYGPTEIDLQWRELKPILNARTKSQLPAIK